MGPAQVVKIASLVSALGSADQLPPAASDSIVVEPPALHAAPFAERENVSLAHIDLGSLPEGIRVNPPIPTAPQDPRIGGPGCLPGLGDKFAEIVKQREGER